MEKNITARASIVIDAPQEQVWDALVNPTAVKQYMFGTNVVSDWRVDSPIVWKGEWQGKAYEDKGVILQFQRPSTLQYSHYSPLTGQPDTPDNYHTVTISLTGEGDQTRVVLEQDNNASQEERVHSEENWGMVLSGLKKYLEA